MNFRNSKDERPCDRNPLLTCGEGGKNVKNHNCSWCYWWVLGHTGRLKHIKKEKR